MAVFTGTSGDNVFIVAAGNNQYDGLTGNDKAIFGFQLTDATISYSGVQVIVDTATSHTVLTGFQTYQFTDGTIEENDGSPLVADLFYYSQNHDVWRAGVDAATHYDTVGWREDRDPNPFFNTSLYLSANPDVAESGVNPLVHFHTIGWTEGRQPSLDFNVQTYLEQNPDVAAARIDPLAHFLQTGIDEGRQPSSAPSMQGPAPTVMAAATTGIMSNGFDNAYYLANNPDVEAAGVDPFVHFQTTGWHEGRNPNAYFDVQGYLAENPDVAAAGVNPLDHFHDSGWREGRNPSPWFDLSKYLAANPDVAAANIDPLLHFLQTGKDEGRLAIDDDVTDRNATADAVIENASAGTDTGVKASWGDWAGITYAMTGDTSGGGFAVNASTGAVTVANGALIDYETAPDQAYFVTVQATKLGETHTQEFKIVVADSGGDVPVLTSPTTESVAENTPASTVVHDVDATHSDTLTYSITGGADAALFSIDAATGEVRFDTSPDFEAPTDAGGNNVYDITVRAANGPNFAEQNVAITVADVNDVPTLDLNTTNAGDDFATVATSGDSSTAISGNTAISDAEGRIKTITLNLSAVSGATGTGEGLHLPAGYEPVLETLGIADITGDGTTTLTITAATSFTPDQAEAIIEQITHANPDTTFGFNPGDRSITVTVTDLNANGNPDASDTQTTTIDMAANVVDTTDVNAFVGANLADTIQGSTGGDTMEGRGGDDTIWGGTTSGDAAGTDIAVFSGNAGEYTITPNSSSFYTVQDNTAGRDGTDSVHDVEILRFDDGDIVVGGANAQVLVFSTFDANTGSGTLKSSHSTIQSAIDAADGNDTVYVRDGVYEEQVAVAGKTDLTIHGQSEAGVIIRSPAGALMETGTSNHWDDPVRANISVENSTNVVIRNLTVDGDYAGDRSPGSNGDEITGVSFLHSSGTIDDVTVRNVSNSIGGGLFGLQHGSGILVDNGTGAQLAVTISDSTVQQFQKTGILIWNANVTLTGNDVAGIGATNLTAQNGIQIGGSAGIIGGAAAADGNTISGLGYIPNGTTSSGMIVYEPTANLTIQNNGITGPAGAHAAAIDLSDVDNLVTVTVSDNTFDTVDFGVVAYTYDGAIGLDSDPVMSGNTFVNILVNGVHFNPEGSFTGPSFQTSTAFTETGSQFADELHGSVGDDNFSGAGGDDTLKGNGGNDTLHGEAGTVDTAVYDEASSNYTVTHNVNTGNTTVAETVVTGTNEGTDTLDGLERLDFASGDMDLNANVLVFASFDQNTGTGVLKSTGYATIQAAINAASAGDTIVVADGTYNENLTVDKQLTILGANYGVAGTGSRSAETILNWTTGNAVTVTTTAPVIFDGLKLTGTHVTVASSPDTNITFTDSVFELISAGNNSNNFYLNEPMSFTFTNNKLDATGYTGALFQPVGTPGDPAQSTVTFTGNTFTGHAGAYVPGDDNDVPLILNLSDVHGVVTGNTFSGVDIGVLVANGTGPLDIGGNTFEHLHRDGPAAGNGNAAGVVFFTPAPFTGTIDIHDNHFNDMDAGIRTSGVPGSSVAGSSITIDDNDFTAVTSIGIQPVGGVLHFTDTTLLPGPTAVPSEFFGGSSNDTIAATSVADIMHGGTGVDTFRFEGSFSDDTVVDWQDLINGGNGEDLVFAGYASETPIIADVLGGVLITVNNGSVDSSVFVAGGSAAQMQQVISGMDLIVH
jgi:hypothetical protein